MMMDTSLDMAPPPPRGTASSSSSGGSSGVSASPELPPHLRLLVDSNFELEVLEFLPSKAVPCDGWMSQEDLQQCLLLFHFVATADGQHYVARVPSKESLSQEEGAGLPSPLPSFLSSSSSSLPPLSVSALCLLSPPSLSLFLCVLFFSCAFCCCRRSRALSLSLCVCV